MKTIFYTGCYTDGQGVMKGAHGEGVESFSLDLKTGEMAHLATLGDLPNPSYLALAPDGLLAVCENLCDGSEVALLKVGEHGSLAITSRQSGIGVSSCHVLAHGDRIYTCSYSDGTLSTIPRKGDSLSAPIQTIIYKGSGTDPNRQEAPHAHQAAASPDSQYLYVCDLGTDTVWMHTLEGVLPGPIQVALRTPKGAGPRHLVFHPTLPIAYVTCELSRQILVVEWNPVGGAMRLKDAIPGYAPRQDEGSSAAAIRIHASGRALYASFRGVDLLCSWQIDSRGNLTPLGEVDAGGRWPRDFNIDPSGEWIVVAHQHSDTLASFRLNRDTLAPEAVPTSKVATNSPCCVLFAHDYNSG